jgi:hypothetical protein
MDRKKILDDFGKMTMKLVRDTVILQHRKTVTGEMKAKRNVEMHELLKQFDEAQMAIIDETVVSTVDAVIHHFLFMLEQHEAEIGVMVPSNDGSEKLNLAKLSDGLGGEMFSEDGWIAKYSSYDAYDV